MIDIAPQAATGEVLGSLVDGNDYRRWKVDHPTARTGWLLAELATGDVLTATTSGLRPV